VGKKYRVIISPEAWGDLDGFLRYISRHSPANAIKVIDRLLAEIDALEIFPKRYAKWRHQRREGRELRSMPSRPFRILYEVLEEHGVVRVVAVQHGAAVIVRWIDENRQTPPTLSSHVTADSPGI
jgi:plasmid stabilization system protein ParE